MVASCSSPVQQTSSCMSTDMCYKTIIRVLLWWGVLDETESAYFVPLDVTRVVLLLMPTRGCSIGKSFVRLLAYGARKFSEFRYILFIVWELTRDSIPLPL